MTRAQIDSINAALAEVRAARVVLTVKIQALENVVDKVVAEDSAKQAEPAQEVS